MSDMPERIYRSVDSFERVHYSDKRWDTADNTEYILADLYDDAQAEIEQLNKWVDDCQSSMYINCVYCGHRYGPDDGDHLNSMRDALREHVAKCPKHPMSSLLTQRDKLADALRVVKDNYDRCRLIDLEDAEIRLEMGKGYMGVPHEECIEAIRAALEDSDG